MIIDKTDTTVGKIGRFVAYLRPDGRMYYVDLGPPFPVAPSTEVDVGNPLMQNWGIVVGDKIVIRNQSYDIAPDLYLDHGPVYPLGANRENPDLEYLRKYLEQAVRLVTAAFSRPQ